MILISILPEKKDLVPNTFWELIPTKSSSNRQNMTVTSNDEFFAPKYVKILMDSSTNMSIKHENLVCINKFNTKKTSTNKWSMMAGSFLTLCEAEVGIKLPKLNTKANISGPFHVTDKKSNYNVIFGTDLLQKLGISLDFQNNLIS